MPMESWGKFSTPQNISAALQLNNVVALSLTTEVDGHKKHMRTKLYTACTL